MLAITTEQVRRALELTRSSDPDVLAAAREQLLAHARAVRTLATTGAVVGALATATLYGAPLGLPLLAGCWWLRRRAGRALAAGAIAYDRHLAALAARGGPPLTLTRTNDHART